MLSFDGELVAKGFEGESYGDINLWGIEKPISVSNALKLLNRNKKTAEEICVNLNNGKLVELLHNLVSLLNQLSRRIRTLCCRINGEHYLRLKIVRMAHNQSLDSRHCFSYKMQPSYLNGHSARCDSTIDRCLNLNNHIMYVLVYLRKNNDVICNLEPVHLNLQNNAHFLLSPEHLSLHFDLDSPENSDIIKQRSNKWFQIRKKAKVTGRNLQRFGPIIVSRFKTTPLSIHKKGSSSFFP